ncbi:G5 and 3D domain-containing protein [Desulfosporosinus youngiae]|uniref:G5 domain-containing protein n=1 Tax=Desulfosporosinus youngiae DSM 17734 TaxID=768710 RepID=H5XRM7_9FIRM|nr:3D domain-containing protein [Desulfosporosinus youngiae]EHQ87286.1 hypothetical protein DesyoDRAFT_0054 [Desulfosporosinus youngiae DSM 17734]
MYSLPITTYSDYWRRTKVWSAYFGSLAILVAGTRYSASDQQYLEKAVPPSPKLHSLSIENVRMEELIDGSFIRVASSRGLNRQGLTRQGQISRGLVSTNADQIAPSSEQVTRVMSKIETVEQQLPYGTEYIESDKLPPGTSEIQVKGEKGIERKVVKTFEADGQPIGQQVLSSFELISPKKEVIIRNTKPIPKKKVVIQNPQSKPAEDVDLANLNISKTLKVEATAYTYTGNNTATGVKPREGLIAVDPKVIALGSKVYVEGYGYAIAADTGGSIRGQKIDVFFSTLRQCIDWGRKSVRVHVLN